MLIPGGFGEGWGSGERGRDKVEIYIIQALGNYPIWLLSRYLIHIILLLMLEDVVSVYIDSKCIVFDSEIGRGKARGEGREV